MDEQVLRKEILLGFEYCYSHDDWVTPWEEALAGVAVEEALWRPGPESKAIWEIVLHVAVWNENIVHRIQRGEPVRPMEGDWPMLPSVWDEESWGSSKKRLWDSLASIRETLENTPMAVIEGSPYGLADLICRFTHNAYHIGQVTKLRECMNP